MSEVATLKQDMAADQTNDESLTKTPTEGGGTDLRELDSRQGAVNGDTNHRLYFGSFSKASSM